MQAGRELDRKLATTLGWESTKLGNWYDEQTDRLKSLPYFSTTWEGMGVLVEEARKKEIFISVIPTVSGYKAELYAFGTQWAEYAQSAPHAATLVFLKVNRISI